MTIGEILLEARRRRGFDITYVASQIPCDIAMIRAWENGRNFPRAEEKFRKIVEVLRIELNDIMPIYIKEKSQRYAKSCEDKPATPTPEPKPTKLVSLEERFKRRTQGMQPKPEHNWCINCLRYFKFNTGYELALYTGKRKDFSEFYCADCWPLLLETLDRYDDKFSIKTNPTYISQKAK